MAVVIGLTASADPADCLLLGTSITEDVISRNLADTESQKMKGSQSFALRHGAQILHPGFVIFE